MKISHAIILILLSFVIGGVSGIAIKPKQECPLGAETDLQRERLAKQKLMQEHIWLNERLKQTPTIDLSIGTLEEWQQAAINEANEKGIDTQDIIRAGSVNVALRSKASEISQLCSNPEATR